MISSSYFEELITITNKSLDRAEELWNNTMEKGMPKLAKIAEAETNIPGHPYLKENDYVSDQFIALMLDMRDSTTHLRQAIKAKVSLMQRVYYEVSALLPTMAKIIQDENGAVTEYLGDGALALFQMPRDKGNNQEKVIYAACRASQKCVEAVIKVICPILNARYQLPGIQIGIGLAFSDAIISRFGHKPNTQIKVIGQCIYFASSLAKEGHNEIFIHEWLEKSWPTSTSPTVRFSSRKIRDFDGYLLESL